MAINKTDKIVCAFISLLIEKNWEHKTFEMKGILFTANEVISKANSLFSGIRMEVKETDLKNITDGKGSSNYDKYLVVGSEDSLSEYYRLSYPDEKCNYNITRFLNILPVESFENCDLTAENLSAFMSDYFSYVKNYSVYKQIENSGIITREAVWIAAAVLTFNEFVRSQSHTMEDYSFQQKTIAALAHCYNRRNALTTCTTNVKTSCTKGLNAQDYSYLIQLADSKRRIAVPEEGEHTRPEQLHEDYLVNTIVGRLPVSKLVSFIDNEYSELVKMGDITSNSISNYVEELVAVDALGDDSKKVDEDYDRNDFLADVFMEKSEYERLVSLVKRKKNVIIQGAPGVGKTYAAKRFAYSYMGQKDPDRVAVVQFHQSYSYEDFIMGFRPTETGFVLSKGIFYDFCKKAETHSDKDFFFIIDEINRGNLSKIFGELFMLIENDKRGIEIQLLYSGEMFSVPSNLYIIGLMNTADRSLSMMDYALRRRFGFFEMRPAFNTDSFKSYQRGLNSMKFDRLIERVEQLNADISEDTVLGEGFCVGHSYFCNLETVENIEKVLSEIVEYEIIPLLKEYWFDEASKVKEWARILRGTVQ